jgi:uncharacterized protein YhdP
VRFNQAGFETSPLAVVYRQSPAQFSIAVGGYVSDPGHAVEARLEGRYPATTVFADVPDLQPALARFPGLSTWTGLLTVDRSDDAGGGRKRLMLSSDLSGTAIDLPAPLAKSADAAEPFELALDVPFVGQPFEAKLGDLVHVRGRLPSPTEPLAARVTFGAASDAPLPARGVAIDGRTPTLDASAWLDLALQANGGDGGGHGLVDGIDLHADDFAIADKHFRDMRVRVSDKDGATELALDGDALAGVLRIPAHDIANLGVSAKFQRFHWPESASDAPDSTALPDIAPAALPPLHIAIDDFMLGQASFGKAELESRPLAGGMHVDRIESHSPNVTMSATGDWTGTAGDNRSHLVVTLAAQNLGHMMDALGFPGLIDGGQTKAGIDAVWPGPPSAFALARLESGTITLKVAEGRIPEVEPGAGRFFGLFSLSEIPRRLTLDFSDFFKSGFTFNSIDGTFRLDAGNAYTSDLLIKSPAADIAISGRTGLRARDYDQQMVVSPHGGATLPIVGAIAAGPVGAAAGLVLQGVLGKPIGKAMGSRYHVSGSWEKPAITLIAKEAPRWSRPESKPQATEAKPQEPDAKPQPSETKAQEPDGKPQPAETKPQEPDAKPADGGLR